ncbi:MAG TPA: aminodeoxychorismate synthase component I [Anaerolineales bacterium]|nr:aminodeoxychorismate synthase component I [Anaerolineales bacterium]HNQ93303.1 aminodeoxychorismate synthase component I [Anaerolineales bacterium]HNS60691.1 aminodeoxychorismate synthase component I [Anaerolineales bacterium]
MIQTNEIVLRDGDAWLHFTNPQRIISADQLHDVLPALREIEDAVNNGFHAAGFISYESAPAFDEAHLTHSSSGFPLLWFGLYPQPRLISLPQPASPKPALIWYPTVSRATYNSAIEQIKNHIADGRTYQVNYTMRLHTEFNADAWNFFLHLAQSQNNHAAYVDTGRFVIASASPELFFQLDGETITCRPMKGTTRRGRTTLEDVGQAEWLKRSEKNRAENVMIVDMIRNDLGRIAKTGSVHVPELFATEKYPTLWQMTSTVKATTDAPLTKILSALFPCASITGAPKVSTMRIISELETTPRKIYTGSIGYIAPNRKAKFNVAIRTALIDRETQTVEYGVGGGIVWDSESGDEYEEALLKARVLTESPPRFSLLETLLWTPEEGFFLREKHIARLLDSAEYFGFSMPRRGGVPPPLLANEIIESYLKDISSQFNSPQRVRLLLDKNGNLSHEAKPFQAPTLEPPSSAAGTPPLASMKISLANQPVNSNNVFLFHKTTHRAVYENTKKDFPEYDDVLLFNERGELTEFTIGNLVVEMDGKFYTPPISCGVLAGTFREYLIETGQVEERVIRVDEIEKCGKMLLVNSVRKWQRAEFNS